MVKLREAEESDLPAILAIYNEVIASSTATFNDRPATLEDRLAWFQARREQGYPVLVASDGSGITGFATFGDFRAWPGYRFTVEHTIYVRADARGTGTGTALLQALIPRAVALGKHVMVAGIDADNEGSIRFHERLGFTRCGRLHEVGYKFGRFLDLVFLQLILEPPAR